MMLKIGDGHVIPEGNAKVGDRVLFCRNPADGDQSVWLPGEVVRIGINNGHGYPLLIEVRVDGEAEHRIISPFCTDYFNPVFHDASSPEIQDAYRTWILPPDAELPEELKNYIARYSNLAVARNPRNSEEPRYRLVCLQCHAGVQVVATMTEVADLEFNPGWGWNNGKLCVDDSGHSLVCSCDDLYGYDDPPGFEVTD